MKLKKYNQTVIYAELELLCEKMPAEMKRYVESGLPNCLQRGLALLVAKAAKGDLVALEFLLNRLVGKVKDQMELTEMKPVIIKRRSGEEVELSSRRDGTT